MVSIKQISLMLSTITLNSARRVQSFSPIINKKFINFINPTMSTVTSSTNLQSTATNFISIPDAMSKLGDSSTIFIDGSWHLSKDRNARSEYEKGPRIQGAYFFDIDDIAVKGPESNPKNLPHMMPKREMFGKVMDWFRVKASSTIIIYGTEGCAFTPRAYYTFKRLCPPSNEVYLMQGSLKEWMDAGGKVENEEKKSILYADIGNDDSVSSEYDAQEDVNSLTMDQMLVEVSDDTNDSIIIDARSAARFRAEAPEPRPGLRLGHMPGAFNVPFIQLLQDDDVTKFKSKEEMKQVFLDAGVDVKTDKKVIVSCGSGVTACVVAVGLMECGRDQKNTYIYDGSWLEWVSHIYLLFLFFLLYLKSSRKLFSCQTVTTRSSSM